MRPRMMRGGAAALVLGLVLMTIVPSTKAQDYTVGPGDALDISVLGEWNAPAVVDPDGKTVIPLAGEIQVAGLTLPQVTEKVTAALKPFIRDPQVMVSIRQATNRKQFVYLLGEVLKPGPYLFREGDHVVDVISAAGGPTPKAMLSNIGVVRLEGAKPSVKPVNLDKFYKSADAAQNVTLQAGDVVYVPEQGGMGFGELLGSLNGLAYIFLLLK